MVVEYNFLKISWIHFYNTIIIVIDVIIYTDKFSCSYQIKIILKYQKASRGDIYIVGIVFAIEQKNWIEQSG
jgi:hypothetical protein